MSSVLEIIGGAMLGWVVGTYVVVPWLERMERRRRSKRRWKALLEEQTHTHPEDRLTPEQLARMEEEERKYWSIH